MLAQRLHPPEVAEPGFPEQGLDLCRGEKRRGSVEDALRPVGEVLPPEPALSIDDADDDPASGTKHAGGLEDGRRGRAAWQSTAFFGVSERE